MNKICIACNKRPARIKFIKIVDGKWQDCMICQTCMMRFASQQGGGVLKLDHILHGLMEPGEGDEDALPGKLEPSAAKLSAVDLSCPNCGLSFVSYRNTLILGCSECYTSFHERLLDDLRRFHGATRHVGRAPEGRPPGPLPMPYFDPAEAAGAIVEVAEKSAVTLADVVEYRRRLGEAVRAENFEEAARLRDRIREAEAQLGLGSAEN